MRRPNGDLNQLVRTLEAGARFTVNDVRPEAATESSSALTEQEQAMVNSRVRDIQRRRPALLMVEMENGSVQYTFLNVEQPRAVRMIGKVLDDCIGKWGL